jgi:SDR family mycofactocin-dependent oxidoreductase
LSTTGRVEGKVALVTGAARGIGRACAVRLAEEGASVVLLDLGGPVETVPYPGTTPAELEAAADEVRALGRAALPVRADVRDGPAMAAAAARAVEELGSLDILVAAAGIDSWGAAWELTDEQWQAMIDVNLTGVWQAAKAAAPHMISRRSGAMVFIGSVLSHRANETFAHYTVAKHGVLGLVKAFGLELAPHMVRVNSVAPTAVSSPMFMNPEFLDHLADKPGASTADVQDFLLRWNAMPQPWIEPVDVANAVLFLASDEARTITGVSLPVDLGAMLK